MTPAPTPGASSAAVLVAAGRGDRLGGEVPKALVRVAGRTLLEHALDRLEAAGLSRVVVVHPSAHEEAFAPLARGADLVPGGATRTASVRAGLAALTADVEVVAVHDAARALMPPSVIARAVATVTGDVIAAAPAVPVVDTLKRVSGETVVGTVDRDDLRAVQTPQVFVRDVLARALASGTDATDDLALVERLVATGAAAGRMVVVPGSALGLKITWPEDVAVAEALDRTARVRDEAGA